MRREAVDLEEHSFINKTGEDNSPPKRTLFLPNQRMLTHIIASSSLVVLTSAIRSRPPPGLPVLTRHNGVDRYEQDDSVLSGPPLGRPVLTRHKHLGI